MKISYLTTVKDELSEIKKLLPILLEHKKEQDEIVILMDVPHSRGVVDYLSEIKEIKLHEYPLNDNFSEFKNYGTSKCTGDYIFNLDADEIPPKYLLDNIHDILEMNDSELIWVPRINIVEGITPELITKFRYKIDENGYINYPDYQGRIYKNDYPRIKWFNPVHEIIRGTKTHSILPSDSDFFELFCIKHIKHIGKQIKQNEKYFSISKGE